MKNYLLLIDGEYSPYASRFLPGNQLAAELGIEYSDDMDIPEDSGWVEIVEGTKPTPTKYQILNIQPELVDGVWTKTYTVVDGDEHHIIKVDGQINAFQLQKRNALLDHSDWTQMPDSPLSDEKKAEWAEYRQALRDLPEDPNWPTYYTMPTRPE